MTQQKSHKRRIRARMARTGERYTTARAHVVGVDPAAAVPAAPEPTSDPAALQPTSAAPAGPSDTTAGTPAPKEELILARTGRSWPEWRAMLDAWGAVGRSHTAIARWLSTEHAVDGWWSQEITVTYERAIGRRAVGQRADGAFAVSVSRTIGVPAERVAHAVIDEEARAAWLEGATLTVRTATPTRGARFDWNGGPERIVTSWEERGGARSTLYVSHERIADRASADVRKAFWADRLDALKALLEA